MQALIVFVYWGKKNCTVVYFVGVEVKKSKDSVNEREGVGDREEGERVERRRERNMSAIVCGKRSSIFEDNLSPPVSKRIRCSSSSPVRFSPPHTATTTALSASSSFDLIHHLTTIFPHMDHKVIGSVCFDLLFFLFYHVGLDEKWEIRIGYFQFGSNLLPFLCFLIFFDWWSLFWVFLIRVWFDLVFWFINYVTCYRIFDISWKLFYFLFVFNNKK